MTTTIAIIEALGSFVVGLGTRFGLFVVAGLALALPALLLAAVRHALVRRGRSRHALALDARVAPNHTWLEMRRRGALRVGLDEIAQRILPSATAVDLPRPGMAVHRGDPIVVVRAGGRALRIGSPVDGTVASVNGRVRRNPALVKEAPYGDGWLFEIAPEGDAWTRLPRGLRADSFILSEKLRLARFIEDEIGIAAADGGDLLAPAPALLGEEGWKKVLAAFLHAA